MHDSFSSFAMARGQCIWSSMPTLMEAASRRRNRYRVRLWSQGVTARRVLLPDGHDPNSFFVQGGDVRQFQSLLEAAQ